MSQRTSLTTVLMALPVTRRPSPIARLLARLRAHRFDRMASVGVEPEPGSAFAAHCARVTSIAQRRATAETLRRLRGGAGTPSQIPLNADDIAAAGDLIDRIVRRLEGCRPVSVRGVSRVRLVIADGGGPLYRCGRGDLAGRLGAALAAL